MNGRIAYPSAALFLYLAFGTAPASAAARIVTVASIEWLTADAEVIVRGRLIEIGPPIEPESGSDRRWATALIAVEETLKGAAAGEELSIVFRDGAEEPRHWHDEDVELLFFLKKGENSAAWASGFRPPREELLLDNAIGGWQVLRLDGESSFGVSPASTMEFKVLRRREDILAAARDGVAAVANMDHPPVAYKVDVPFDSDVYPSRTGLSILCQLTVPVDDRLERHARQWIRSGSASARFEGIGALRFFRSEENTRLLETLLDDTTVRTSRQTAEGAIQIYSPFAERSAQVLKMWDEDEAPSSGRK